MSTTAANITTDQISTLRDEAGVAGDLAQVALCKVAVGEGYGDVQLDEADASFVGSYTLAEARGACADVIRYAEQLADA